MCQAAVRAEVRKLMGIYRGVLTVAQQSVLSLHLQNSNVHCLNIISNKKLVPSCHTQHSESHRIGSMDVSVFYMNQNKFRYSQNEKGIRIIIICSKEPTICIYGEILFQCSYICILV